MPLELHPTDRLRHLDVLIIGAGISGIGAAHHLQEQQPEKRYAILEARREAGGTWDLFRYPGIRSDSDLHTFGYSFRPWTDERAIADGQSIKDYIVSTAEEAGIHRHIRFGHRVVSAAWSSERARWDVTVVREGEKDPVELTARWLFCAGGYYSYESGYTPDFEGIDAYRGQVIHPQHWPEGLDYRGKRVVVIGSGATAVTLVPAMAGSAEHVTMLQRSPSYIVPLPASDPLSGPLTRLLGEGRAFSVIRRKNILRQSVVYRLARRFPKLTRRVIRSVNAKLLPPQVDVDVHFKPRYEPWDQRLCVVPDGDLYRVLQTGRASVVTDQIATFTEKGVRLRSGRELEADIVVTATGLNLQAFGGISISVDGAPVRLNETIAYKGTMLSGVPNFAYAIGYTNASWTLKVDLVCDYFCRLLAYLDEHRFEACVPQPKDPHMDTRPLLDFPAGYVLRALDRFPCQGERAPWHLAMSYAKDLRYLRDAPLDDGELRFQRRQVKLAEEPVPRLARAA